jgi:hypothetical protein
MNPKHFGGDITRLDTGVIILGTIAKAAGSEQGRAEIKWQG